MINFKNIMKYNLICICVLTVFFMGGCGQKDVVETPPAEPVEEVEIIDETISIFAVGDNLMHMPVVNSGKLEDGTYDFSDIYKELQPDISEADIAVINQETIFGGEEFGYSGFPTFNTPSDVGKTLVKEGFDVVLHASNHVFDKGVKGVENTLEFWEDYPEVTVLGINESPQAMEEVKIMEVKGAKLAMLNYTYGTNGLTVPSDKSYLANLIDEEKIEKDVTYAEANADFTIVFIHWGEEYVTSPTIAQKELSELMCELGVDLVIGAHPHVIEPVEWYENDNGNKMLVYYSLGNFVSRQMEVKNLLGAIADVELSYDGEKVAIEDYAFIPIVTHYNSSYSEYTVYKLGDYPDELAPLHGLGSVSRQRWEDMVYDIFADYDIDMIKMR